MSTLWRYIGAQFLRSSLASAGILILMVLVVDMLLNMDEIFEARETFFGAIGFLVIRTLALYLPYLIPAAVFTGAFVSLGVAARSREIIAVKAGGVSPLRAVVPVFGIAALLSFFALFVGETVTVRASAALNQELGEEPGEISVRSGSIWYHTGRFIYNIRNPDPESESVGDIRVLERNEAGRLVRLIHGRRAVRLEPRQWRFENATVRHFAPEDPMSPPRVERADEIQLELAEDRSVARLQRELPGLSLLTIANYVRAVLDAGGDPRRARAHLHERLTRPLLVLLFALLAIPLALSVEQTRSLALPALQGVVVLFFFLLLREYAGNLTASGGIGAAIVPWAVIGAFALYGGWRLARVPQ